MVTSSAPRTLPSLLVPVGSITPYVLVVGDPDRAKHFSERLDDARQVGRFREFHTFQGTWRGIAAHDHVARRRRARARRSCSRSSRRAARRR